MRNLRLPLVLILLCLFAGMKQVAAQVVQPSLDIESQSAGSEIDYDETNGVWTATNKVVVRYADTSGLTVLTADNATINRKTGDIFAQGSVRVQRENETWVGDRLHYNYQTHQMEGDKFRLGQSPFYVAGEALHGVGEGTNAVYQGTNVVMTTDDYYQPLMKVRAKRFTIVPGNYIEAHNATLYVGKVPVFFLPYYHHSLVHEQNEFSFLPGYRSLYGPYLLSSYNWFLNDQLSGALHLDYRETRGLAAGPDFNFRLGQFGDGTLRYYYARDQKPGVDPGNGTPLPNDRQRFYINYSANPLTNLTIMSQVAYQTDPFIIRDFFESEYRKNIQPATFVDANQFWQNWSLDALAQPRINPFWETVERLPDVRLTGFRQQIGNSPFYYESESSLGYFRRLYSSSSTNLNTNMFGISGIGGASDYAAARADTFHQITLPETFFGWLNVTPRVGGRFTYYNDVEPIAASNLSTNISRGVFNTGAEVSFTASRVWPGVENHFWDVDGLRHIFQPSMNYVYIPRPSALPSQLPQFDYEQINSLRLTPLEFPEYNAIDSINSQNTIRYGLNNRLQTKRNGQVDDLINWGVYMDWHLQSRSDQTTLSDIYSDFTLKPRSWLLFNSSTRYSIEQGQFNLSQHTLTLQPNNTWNWSIGHLYLRSGPIFGPTGDNLFTSIFFYRLNENWGTRVAHYFDANTGTLQEQDYTIYRDLRSWTAALTFRALNNLSNGKDYTIAFTFSFKSFPRFGLGGDTVRSAPLVGY